MAEEAIPGLRDFVAVGALAVLGTPDWYHNHDAEHTATFCYKIADAFLKEREQKEESNGTTE